MQHKSNNLWLCPFTHWSSCRGFSEQKSDDIVRLTSLMYWLHATTLIQN